MSDIRVIKSWDELNPVVYDGDEPVSTRKLERDYRDALGKIQELEQQLRWIPVSERLPEMKHDSEWGSYSDDFLLSNGCDFFVGYFCFNGQWVSADSGVGLEDIAHWLPIPSTAEIDNG